MKIVIDISDELYRILKKNEEDIRRNRDALKLSVIDGIILPKGHGDLIDRPTGKWIKVNNPNYSPFDGTCGELSVCPFCGYKTSYKPHKFCPDCGAIMEAENE